MNTLELIICSVTLPSSVVCRSDSNGPQKASFCSAAPLSMCWQRSVGLMDWYCGPWSTKKSSEIKGWHTEENRLFYGRRTCSDKTRTVKVPYDGIKKKNYWFVAYRVIAGMFPVVTPLLSVIDLQQQAIWHVHILCCLFLSLQITQH